MVLPWKNYLETNEVSFITTDNVKYIGYPDGNDYILKIKNNISTILDDDAWDIEKIELSNLYSDIYGTYTPRLPADLDIDDDKGCVYGKTPDGLYLDRLQRREDWMDHRLTADIIQINGWGILHTPDNGKTLYKTEWCNRLGEYYNVMRCDVFPDNPGWKKLDKEELLIELADELDNTEKENIINCTVRDPSYEKLGENHKINPIGNVLIS
jgi:hypothetical protein|tara:strand:- start:18 stop:650 length:633 start_codon:yes stop_codon:yes gene_type:complete